MYSKLRFFIQFIFIIALSSAGMQYAHGQVADAAAKPTTGTLHGHITDPTGALIPGSKITVSSAHGSFSTTVTADAAGGYAVKGLAPGDYVVQATAEGFSPFISTPITVTAGQTKRVDIAMAIEAAQQSVVVTDEGEPTVSIEAGSNSSSMVLKDKDLDALSDDPDELQNELQALAGPSAGPNGGQIYIDGFTGGQLPPKSAIREIRINQNPFSAEFDRLGYGRIEILTKPGTDTLHGRVFGMGNAKGLNTGNPFTTSLPSYHSFQYNGTVSGPMSKWASFFFSIEQRNIQNDNVYSIIGGPVYDSATNLYSISGGSITGSIFSPQNHLEVAPRVDLQLGQKNTLTLRYQYFRNSIDNSLGSINFPSTASSSRATENTFQFDDTQIITDRIVNETRFEYRRGSSTATPASTAPSFSVSGVFGGGGNGGQFSSGHSDHFELQNFTTMTAGQHAIKFGTWMRDNRSATSTNANYNGSFLFPSVTAFVDTWNGIAQGKTIAQIQAECQAQTPPPPGGCTPLNLTYTTGPQGFKANVYNAAFFFQDDWKVNPNLTLSGGIRWESQNHIPDHNDWAPRVAFAYALDGHKTHKPLTVLRGGYGFFYDRFGTGNLMNLEMLNGTANSQTQITIANPTCFNGTDFSSLNLSSCGDPKTLTPEIYQLSPNYRSPNTEQVGVSVERQVSKFATLTVTYLHSFGIHQLVVRDANAYLPGTYQYGNPNLPGTRPDPKLGIVQQFYPEAVFKQNQLTVNINARFSQNFGIAGFYNLTSANSNGGGGSRPSNSYNLNQDYGRAAFVRPQWLFLMGNYSAPWGISFNPFLIAQAGSPYNIRGPYDLTGDSFFNNRPAYATSASNPSHVVQTSYGALDLVPQPGEKILPINVANGPAAFALNLRVSRAFGLGPKVASTGGPSPGGMGGGPHGHMRGGFGGGPFGHGGMRGGMTNTGRKYALTFSAQALNLFNDINLGTPHGSIVPTFNPNTGLYGPGAQFGKSSNLAGGIFSTQSAARRIYLQAAFQF